MLLVVVWCQDDEVDDSLQDLIKSQFVKLPAVGEEETYSS